MSWFYEIFIPYFPDVERSRNTRGQRSAPELLHAERGANATDDVALSTFSSAFCWATAADATSDANVYDAAGPGCSRNAVETSNRYHGKRQQ